MFIQSDITKRVLSVYYYLIENGLANNQREFCKRIKMPYWSWAPVKSKRRDFCQAYLKGLCDTYNVNPDYLFKGTGGMFKNDKTPYPEKLEGTKRIFVKDIKVTEDSDRILLTYVDYKGEIHTFEYLHA